MDDSNFVRERRKRNEIKSYIDNAILEIKEIDPIFANKLLEIEINQESAEIQQILKDYFEKKVISLKSEISAFELRKQNLNKIDDNQDDVDSSKSDSILMNFLGTITAFALFLILIADIITFIIIFAICCIYTEVKQKRYDKNIKKRLKHIQIIEKHKQAIAAI